MTYSEFRNQFTDVEEFRHAYGALTYEEAKALIDAETSPIHIKACMISTWKTARLEVRLQNVRVNIHDDDGLSIVFYEDDSAFDGNDFSYTFRFDRANTQALLKEIGTGESAWEIEKWLQANIRSRSTGYDFADFCEEHGIHGTRTVHEDYPGGIHREESL